MPSADEESREEISSKMILNHVNLLEGLRRFTYMHLVKRGSFLKYLRDFGSSGLRRFNWALGTPVPFTARLRSRLQAI